MKKTAVAPSLTCDEFPIIHNSTGDNTTILGKTKGNQLERLRVTTKINLLLRIVKCYSNKSEDGMKQIPTVVVPDFLKAVFNLDKVIRNVSRQIPSFSTIVMFLSSPVFRSTSCLQEN